MSPGVEGFVKSGGRDGDVSSAAKRVMEETGQGRDDSRDDYGQGEIPRHSCESDRSCRSEGERGGHGVEGRRGIQILPGELFVEG